MATSTVLFGLARVRYTQPPTAHTRSGGAKRNDLCAAHGRLSVSRSQSGLTYHVRSVAAVYPGSPPESA